MNKRDKEYIKEVLSVYREIEYNQLNKFNIIHMYDAGKGSCFESGYVDAKWINLIFYNTFDETKFKINRQFDGISFYEADISFSRLFLDGSTIFKMQGMHEVIGSQDAYITRVERLP